MKPLVTRNGLVKILILTAVFILAFMAFYPLSPAGRQARNLATAREHAMLLAPKIKADPRFENIRLGGYTGGDGMFMVVGSVSSDAHLTALRQLVTDSEPPVKIKWSVKVLSFPPEKKNTQQTN